MAPSNSSYLSNMAIFHFHDYGRKSTRFQSEELCEGGTLLQGFARHGSESKASKQANARAGGLVDLVDGDGGKGWVSEEK